ncbi:nucleolar GTP-binding protein NOG1 [Acrasis kona]|uniref:Nucleolar GTP-binding protein 1 n=1 Tax=Acrasis kona TaxID=1008807 RepID=A0AAW2YYT4_9EUKA
MVVYNFKKIRVVPPGKDFVDIILSKTQRKTPTVVHPQYNIHRIRKFYMRKVKFTQTTIHERMSAILEDFPRLEDIHPFYSDLLNVLYDKDHYKLALGQLNTARNLVDALGRDYVRLLKYGDSLFRCKQLKRAALGRMATILKGNSSSLLYLEQVRQHLSRLPNIDPSTRTIILTGFPNVGKSSFMNKVTRAEVDVQPYPFTTKSLFVGHTDYKCLKWQVIDSPGILDHPLEDRNTIEMQSITALAHLRSCVLFLVDVSEHCGYSIKQQVDLFHNIKPLFSGKPILLVLTKIDLVRFEELTQEKKDLLQSVADEVHDMMGLSNITQEGVANVKQAACDKLLEHRVEIKMNKTGKSVEGILSRIHLAQPEKRDHRQRATFIPQSVTDRRNDVMDQAEDGAPSAPKRKTVKEIEDENGGAGVYQHDMKKDYLLKNPDWKYDVIPEIFDGRNIADFIDPEIEKLLDELEKEEEVRLEEPEVNYADDEIYIEEEDEDVYEKIMSKKSIYKQKQQLNRRANNHTILPRKNRPVDLDAIQKELMDRGVDKETLDRVRSRSMTRDASVTTGRGRSLSTTGRSKSTSFERARSVSQQRVVEEREANPVSAKSVLGKRKRSLSTRNRSQSATDKLSGLVDAKQQVAAIKLGHKKQRLLALAAKRGEADRKIPNEMPKHLFSGKRSIGKTDRR